MTRDKSSLSSLFKKAISVITGIAFLLLGYFFIKFLKTVPEENINGINQNTLQMLRSEIKEKPSSEVNNTRVQLKSENGLKDENTNQIILSNEEEKFSEFVSDCLIAHVNKRGKELELTSSLQNYLPKFNQILQGLEVSQIDLKTDRVIFKFLDQNIEYDELATSLEILCHLNLIEGRISCPSFNIDRAEQLAKSLIVHDGLNSYPYILLSLIYDKLGDQHKSADLLDEARTKTDHFDIYFESKSQKLTQLYEKIDDYIYISQVTSTLPMPNLFKIGQYLKSKNSFFAFYQMLEKNLNPQLFAEGINISFLDTK